MRVVRYVFWRVVRGALTVLTMVAIAFTLYFAIEKQPPVGNYFPAVSRGVPATPHETNLVRHLFFLDRSKPGLYLDYVAHLARGDFGHTSTIDQKGKIVDAGSAANWLFPPLRATLSILGGGALLVLLFSLPLGAISGSRLGSWYDRFISFGALLLVCMHPMMLGLILRSAGNRVGWLPTTGYCPFTGHAPLITSLGVQSGTCGGPVDWASHLALPWLTFALLFLALYTRIVRANVAETIHEDFVRTARAKGASQTRVLARHVLPNVGLRVLTMVGMEIGTAIGVSIYIESAFNIFGLGRQAVAVLGGGGPSIDLMVTTALVVLITLVVVIGNLVVDLLYSVLDPRVGLLQGEQRTKSFVGGVF